MLEIDLMISETNGAEQICDRFHSYSYFKPNIPKYGPIPSIMNSYDHVGI